MKTAKQTETPGLGSRNYTGPGFGMRAETTDVVLLLLTMLALLGTAAGIIIGFPMALEIVATQANAATTMSLSPQPPDPPVEPEEDGEDEDEPLFVDDIRTEGLMYALGRSVREHPAPAAAASTEMKDTGGDRSLLQGA